MLHLVTVALLEKFLVDCFKGCIRIVKDLHFLFAKQESNT